MSAFMGEADMPSKQYRVIANAGVQSVPGLLLVVALHWPAFTALFGYGRADFSLIPKQQPIPLTYVVTMLAITALCEVLPYLEELMRGLRYRRWS